MISGLDNNAVIEHVLPIIQKLTQGDWFTARVSACGLFATSYSRLTDPGAKATLRAQFNTLCKDETPMVKRAAAKAIGAFAKAAALERDALMTELLPLFDALAADDQDSVRLLAIENCTAFASVMGEAENNKHILPLVKVCAQDKSWRVRNNVAREFAALARSVGRETSRGELLPLFVKLLTDPEAEVRAAGCRNLASFTDLVGTDKFLSDLQPLLRELIADPAQNVRTGLAEALMDTASRLPQETASSYVVPFVMQALKDEAPEVRLKILEALGKIVDAVGPAFLENTILPAMLQLGNDALWRVREKVIEQMPLLASHLVSSRIQRETDWASAVVNFLPSCCVCACAFHAFLFFGPSHVFFSAGPCFVRREGAAFVPVDVPGPGECGEDGGHQEPQAPGAATRRGLGEDQAAPQAERPVRSEGRELPAEDHCPLRHQRYRSHGAFRLCARAAGPPQRRPRPPRRWLQGRGAQRPLHRGAGAQGGVGRPRLRLDPR